MKLSADPPTNYFAARSITFDKREGAQRKLECDGPFSRPTSLQNWQRSADGLNWTDIENANFSTTQTFFNVLPEFYFF